MKKALFILLVLFSAELFPQSTNIMARRRDAGAVVGCTTATVDSVKGIYSASASILSLNIDGVDAPNSGDVFILRRTTLTVPVTVTVNSIVATMISDSTYVSCGGVYVYHSNAFTSGTNVVYCSVAVASPLGIIAVAEKCGTSAGDFKGCAANEYCGYTYNGTDVDDIVISAEIGEPGFDYPADYGGGTTYSLTNEIKMKIFTDGGNVSISSLASYTVCTGCGDCDTWDEEENCTHYADLYDYGDILSVGIKVQP